MPSVTKAQLLVEVETLRKSLEHESTTRQQAERKLAEALEQQTATSEILRVISRSPTDVQPVFDAVVANAVRLCGAQFGTLIRFDGRFLHFAAHHKLNSAALEFLTEAYPRPLDTHPLFARAIRERRVVQVADVEADPDVPSTSVTAGRMLGYRSQIVVPITGEGVPLGTLSLGRVEPGLFSERQITLLQTFADQALIAIENVRLFTELEEKNQALTTAHAQVTDALEQQTATSEILQVISSSPTDVQPVFNAIAVNALRLCDAQGAVVVRYDGALLHVAAHHNVNSEAVDRLERQYPVAPDRDSPMGEAVLDGAVVHVPDLQAAVEYSGSVARQFGARSHVSIPLLHQGRAVGAIAISRRRLGPFTDRQIELLKSFADQAVIAIENVRLFKELQTQNQALTQAHAQVSEALERQTATSEILRVISESPTDVQPVFDTIVRNTLRLCDAKFCVTYRYDGEQLHVVAHNNLTPEMLALLNRRYPQPPSRETATGVSILERRVVHITDATLDNLPPASREFARQQGWGSMLAVPLLRDGRPVGNIAVSRVERQPFTEQQIALVQTFADQAVIAIENVRLFKELEAKNRDLTEALDQQTATSEILRVISSSPTDLEPVAQVIADSASRLCDSASSGVFRLDGDLIHWVASRGTSGDQNEALRDFWPRPADRETLTGRTILARETLHIHDAASDPSWGVPAARAALAIRSFLGVPMLREGQPIGVITLVRSEVRPFSEREIALVQTFADQAIIAIENVRLFKELEEKNRALTEAHAQATEALEQQTATSEILAVISNSPTDVQPVFETIVERAGRLCDATFGGLHRFDGEWITLDAHYNVPPEELEYLQRYVFPFGAGRHSATGRAVLDRAVVHVQDVLSDAEYRLATPTTYRTVLSVPMLRDERPIGAVTLWRREVRPFSERQIQLVTTFADQAVIAIENVRLFTELQEKNRQITEALEQQTATAEILRVISGSPTDVQPVMNAVVEAATRLTGADHALIGEMAGDSLYWLASHGGPVSGTAVPISRALPSGRAILDRRTTQEADIRTLAKEFPHIAALQDTRTALATPLLREGVAVGVLLVSRREVRPFTDKQIALLQTFADQAVIAIENVRLFKELEARNQDLTTALEQQTATSEILRVISRSGSDVQPVFDAIAESARGLLRGWGALVVRVDGRLLHATAISGGVPGSADVLRDQFPMPAERGASFVGDAIHDREVKVITDIETDERWTDMRARARARGWRANIAVPMLQDGRPIGALTVSRVEPGPFTPQEIELLKTFADQAVIAIENARLLNELQRRTQELSRSVGQLTALGEVGRAVSSTLDLETVLTTIVSRAVQLSGLDGGVVFEYDEATEEFVHRAGMETGDALAGVRRASRIPKGEGVLGRTAVTLEPVQVPDITVVGAYESRLRDNLIQSGVRAILAVPMVRESQLIGCLGVTRNRPGEFPPATIELLRTFATQSALAIQNARLYRELEQKSRELEAASQHKSEFLANMSHELRTPLNAIIGFSDVLTERMFGELNEKQDEYVKDISASGTHLLSLINDILDLSKIEAGRMELEVTDFDLPQAIDNALTLVRERAGRRGIALHQGVDERLGQVRGDERKVKQVLLNLLSNALKFTPEGGRIDVRAGMVDGMAEVSVTDTGVGIAPEDQEAVFEEFRQVGGAEKKAEGTGLGLTLCRKFIELHGGRISVKSQVGVGSTFTFTLPVGRGE